MIPLPMDDSLEGHVQSLVDGIHRKAQAFAEMGKVGFE